MYPRYTGKLLAEKLKQSGLKIESEIIFIDVFDKYYLHIKNRDRFVKYMKEFVENEIEPSTYEEKIIFYFVKNNTFLHTIDNYIYRFGDKNGKLKWNKYQNDRKETYKTKKQSGFKQNNGRSLEEYVKRHGFVEGTNLWIVRNDNHSKRFTKEWYINTHGEELGEQKYIEYLGGMDKTSLKHFIKKYGKINGLIKFKENGNKIRNGQQFKTNLIGFKKRYGSKLGEIKFDEYVDKVCKGIGKAFRKKYSKKSQLLFWKLYNDLSEDKRNTINFAELNKEHSFAVNGRIIKYMMIDFKCKNVIIEFQGTYWHKSEKDKKRDRARKRWLEKNNYKVLFVKEKSYDNNEKRITKKCLEFINENYEH